MSESRPTSRTQPLYFVAEHQGRTRRQIPRPGRGRSRRDDSGPDRASRCCLAGLDPARESLRDRVMALTRDRGADVVCEAVGKPELVAEAIALTRDTGVLQLVGVNPKGSRLALDLWDVHYRKLRFAGAFGRGTAFRRALALMPKLGVKRLVTARFPLERIADAFAHAAAGHGAKTVIAP